MGVNVPNRELEASEEFAAISSALQGGESTSQAVARTIELSKAAVHSYHAREQRPTDQEIWAWDATPLSRHVYLVDESIIEIAARTPPKQQESLIDFVIQLSRQTVIDPVSGETACLPDVTSEKLWTGLPLFISNISDARNAHAKLCEVELGIITKEPVVKAIKESYPEVNIPGDKFDRHMNLTGFIAQLMASSENAPFSDARVWGPFGFFSTAQQAFFSAFDVWVDQPEDETAEGGDDEDEDEDEDEGAEFDDGKKSGGDSWDTESEQSKIVPISEASAFMIHAADRIYDYCMVRLDDSKPLYEPGRSHWIWGDFHEAPTRSDWWGYSPEKWNLWVNGLKAASENTHSKVQPFIQRAIDAAERVSNRP